MQVLYERCAAVDVGKDVIAVAVRLPGDGPDGRQTVKRTFKTLYGVLGEAARWLTSLGVTHVAMEATIVIFSSNKFSSSFRRSGLLRTRL
jgi:transposase